MPRPVRGTSAEFVARGVRVSACMAQIVVYGTPWCSFSLEVKRLLEMRGAGYEFVDLDSRPGLRDELEAVSGNRTMPQVLIDGHPIGGYSELVRLDAAGQLERLASR